MARTRTRKHLYTYTYSSVKEQTLGAEHEEDTYEKKMKLVHNPALQAACGSQFLLDCGGAFWFVVCRFADFAA